MPLETVVGKYATNLFDTHKRIHSRGCVLSRADVVVPNLQGRWTLPDAQDTKAADSNAAPIVNTVLVRENGPLAIEAELLVRGRHQTFSSATRRRYGQTKKKPIATVTTKPLGSAHHEQEPR